MPEITLRIDGMHCAACIHRLTLSLGALPGVQVEEVRLGAARVHQPDDARANVLIAGLAKAGFAAQEEK